MNKVFVWKSYGDIEVYFPETKEQKQKLKELLVDCLVQEGSTSVTKDSPWMIIDDAIYEQVISGSDLFEYDTGFTSVKELN